MWFYGVFQKNVPFETKQTQLRVQLCAGHNAENLTISYAIKRGKSSIKSATINGNNNGNNNGNENGNVTVGVTFDFLGRLT